MKYFDFKVGERTFRSTQVADYAICPAGGKRSIGFYQLGEIVKKPTVHVEPFGVPVLENEIDAVVHGMKLMGQFMAKPDA